MFPRKSKIGPDRVCGPSVIRGSAFKCKHAESRALTKSYETELHIMLLPESLHGYRRKWDPLGRIRINQQFHAGHQRFSELHLFGVGFVARHFRVDELSAK